MPRFGLKTMLVAFAAAALWLSTSTAYAAANDVRRSVLFLILVAAGFAAVYLHGKRRAFWAGFFVAMLLCGDSNVYVLGQFKLNRYVPDFNWLTESAANYVPAYYSPAVTPPSGNISPVSPSGSAGPPPVYAYASPSAPVRVNPPAPPLQFAAISTAWILTLAVVSGFIAATIYEHGRTTKTE